MMNQVANVLKTNGVVKGDRVAIYIPASPIAVASMLACARIGAVHSVVFAGFSAEALASRIIDGIRFVHCYYRNPFFRRQFGFFVTKQSIF